MIRSFLFTLSILFVGLATAQNTAYKSYDKEQFISKKDTLPYRVLPPKGIKIGKKYPLVLLLHGSGERGKDNQLQLTHGASFFASDSIQKNFPAFVVFPQCNTGQKWSFYQLEGEGETRNVIYNVNDRPHAKQKQLMAFVNYLVKTYPIDSSRLYVGGLSMGGMGTLDLIKRNPNTFAAAFSICGGAHPKTAKRIKKTPLWLFHGKDDLVIPSRYSEELYQALLKKEAKVKITLYPETGHDSWTATFKEPDLMEWLFKHSKESD